MDSETKIPASGGEIIKVNFQQTRPHDRPELEGTPTSLLDLIEHLENGTTPSPEPTPRRGSAPDG